MKSLETSQRRRHGATLALVALMVVGLAAGTASAHEAENGGAHGEIRASTNAEDCSVDVDTINVDSGSVWFKILDSEDEVLTKVRVHGHPQPDPGPARFAHGIDVHLTGEEAARLDKVALAFMMDGEMHSTSNATESFECEEEVTPPPCPPVTDVRSENPNDPENTFTIHKVEDATAYRVYRATEGGDFMLLEQVEPGGSRGDPDAATRIAYVDEDVEAGVTYQYKVTGINAAGESMDCPEHEITTIPFFGAPVMVLLATAGSVGAYVALRRRK